MGRVSVLPALLGLVCLAQSPHAVAQVNPRGIQRPSYASPSRQLGIIGGRMTQVSPQVLNPGPRQTNLGMPVISMPQPTGRRHAPRLGGQRSPASIRLGEIPSPENASLFRSGLLTDFNVGAASGFYTSISADTPLYGWVGLNVLPGRDTPVLEPVPPASAHHRFFNLVPERPPLDGAPESLDSVLDLVEERNQWHLNGVCKEAFEVFAQATADRTSSGDLITGDQQLALLRQSARLLDTARTLSKAAPSSAAEASRNLPVLDLLEAHAHLECNRERGFYIDQAVGCLIRAARDDADAFLQLAQEADRPIAAYFGDYRDGRSILLERQMLQYVQLSTVDAPTLDTLLLQAYCAWVLKDGTRASRALDEAERTLRARVADPAFAERSGLIAALRYALQEAPRADSTRPTASPAAPPQR